jgi:hypothetical protein
MVYGVKGCGKVKKDKCRNFLLVGGKKKVIVNSKKSSFSGMIFTVGRLKRAKGGKSFQMVV